MAKQSAAAVQPESPREPGSRMSPPETARSERPREFAKSAVTRRRILDAAVQCLVEVGYFRTSTNMVAERSGLARSAMQYHFPTRADLVAALVWHVHYERSIMFAQEVEPFAHRPEMVGPAIDVYWRQVQHPLFIAYSEIHFAARTDEELAAILKPIFAEYERDRVARSRQLYPEAFWAENASGFDLARDVTRFTIEGMALSTLTYQSEERIAAVLAFVKAAHRDGRLATGVIRSSRAEPAGPPGAEPTATAVRPRRKTAAPRNGRGSS